MKVFLFFIIVSLFGVQTIVSGLSCLGVPTGSTAPDTNNCAKYFLCLDGAMVSRTCPSPYGYNPTSGRCEYNPKCLNNEGPNPGPGTGPTVQNPCIGRQDGTYLPSPLSCKLFYICMGGMAVMKNCPDGYAYDSLEAACVKRTESCF